MPANGTAGLARSAVRGINRLPSPPASTMARTFLREGMRSTVSATGTRTCRSILGGCRRRPGGAMARRRSDDTPVRVSSDGNAASVPPGRRPAPPGDRATCPRLVGVRVDVLSKEYPPEIYGGAGVHVAELV